MPPVHATPYVNTNENHTLALSFQRNLNLKPQMVHPLLYFHFAKLILYYLNTYKILSPVFLTNTFLRVHFISPTL